MKQCFYTKFGDVYEGIKFYESEFPDFTIVIQPNRYKEYIKLKNDDKTLEKINEYGWVLGNDVIELVIDSGEPKPSNQYLIKNTWDCNCERKVMFVFGAGASNHCVYGSDIEEFENDTLRPPLGPGLFEKRFKKYYTKYKGVKQSLHFLQDDMNPDVEELFEQEWKNIFKDNNQEVLSRHINIQYYLQEVLENVSNRVKNEYYAKNLYAKLADRLQKLYAASNKNRNGQVSTKKIAFVSFNQDTILEHFVSEYFKTPIVSIDDYVNINENQFCIFKPHGSCNWGWQFPNTIKFGNSTANWLFDNNINYFQLYYTLLGNRIDMIDWSTWGVESMINKYRKGKYTIDKSKLKIIDSETPNNYFPALLLPYRDKDEFTMPLQHFNYMHSYFSYVETLIIIGWKGNEDAFNRQLLQQGDKINKVIIADPNPDIVIKNIKPLLSKCNITPIIYKGFEDFVKNGIDKDLN